MIHAREDYNRIQDPDGKIPADEPVFLLRGQDQLAAEAVRFYARSLARLGGLLPDDNLLEMSRYAFLQADAMDAWKRKKTPDMPAPTDGEH